MGETYYDIRWNGGKRGKADYRSLWRTRAEVEEYGRTKTAEADAAGKVNTWEVEEVHFEGELLYNSPHSTSGFSLWSVGGITRAVQIVENYRGIDRETGQPYKTLNYRNVPFNKAGLTDAAVGLIGTTLASDSAKPPWLARVRDVKTATVRQSRSKMGGYQGPQVDRLKITLDDGTILTQWVTSEGYGEGYTYEFHDTARAANWSIDRGGWVARECLECGAVYDTPGYVEPGEMGCDRCNGDTETDWQRHIK